MFRSFKYRLITGLISLVFAGSAALAAVPVIMDAKDILPYLEKMISWHRAATTLDISPELPRELILRASLQQHTTQALDGSFTVARALAETIPEAPKPAVIEDKLDAATKEINIRAALSRAEEQAQQMQAELAHARTHTARDKLTGELKLSQEHISVLKQIGEAIGIKDDENDSLQFKINQLAGTVTEVDDQKTGADTAAAAAPPAFSTSGIIGLATRIYIFIQEKSAAKSALNDTKNVYNDNKDRTKIIGEALKGIMQEGITLGDKPPAPSASAPPAAKPQAEKPAEKSSAAKPGDAKVPAPAAAAPQATYDDLVTQMKQLSKVAVALSQTNKSLLLCVHDLSDWVDLISTHIKDLLSQLVFRLSMLGLAIGIAILLSMLASKAIRRYVHDRRRRDQLRNIRKITLAFTITVILFLAFFTDLNSLATFAGLLTAGIAFAMKDMILSMIAYFQFFSSSDIQPGDTITLAGVTGRITEIGMLRFYMLEMEKSDIGFLPTGRIVGFANNILFQPAPFFSQTPGVNFVWNEISISLAHTVDHNLVYKKLSDIVHKMYARHQEVIKNDEAALQKVSPFKLDVSEPLTYFKFTNMGIIFIIRYAVDRDQAQAVHMQMTSELLQIFKKDPELRALHIN